MEEHKKNKNNEIEVWTKLDDEYEVSNIGGVKALNYYKRGIEYILPQHTNNKGYKTVHAHRKNELVHRLIWQGFNGEIPEGMEIDHINTDPTDNRLSNLRLVTHKENMANELTHKRVCENNRKKAQDENFMKRNLEMLNEMHKDPTIQAKLREGIRKKWEDKNHREKMAEVARKRSENITWRENVTKALQNKSEQWKENISKSKKKQFENPDFLEKHRERMRNRSEEWRRNSSNALKKKLSKPILQYDMQGSLIREWSSIREITRTLGYNRGSIYQCCIGKYKQAYGSIWRYKNKEVA